jgi:hypothetical protein
MVEDRLIIPILSTSNFINRPVNDMFYILMETCWKNNSTLTGHTLICLKVKIKLDFLLRITN